MINNPARITELACERLEVPPHLRLIDHLIFRPAPEDKPSPESNPLALALTPEHERLRRECEAKRTLTQQRLRGPKETPWTPPVVKTAAPKPRRKYDD